MSTPCGLEKFSRIDEEKEISQKREEIFEEQESAEEKEEPTSVEDKEKDQHSECRRIVDESPPKSKSVPFTNILKSKQKKKVEFNTNFGENFSGCLYQSASFVGCRRHLSIWKKKFKELCSPKRAPRTNGLSIHVSAMLLNQIP